MGTRQTATLPCAQNKTHGKPHAHGKIALCRVPAPGTHGKNQTHGILLSLLCAVLKTHGKPRARATHVRRWRTEVDGGATEVDGAQLCRVPHGAHGKQATSPCATAWHTANKTLRRVLFSWHTANNLKILNFQTRNFFYAAETLLGTLY